MFFSGNKQIIVEGGESHQNELQQQQQQQQIPFGMPPFHPSMMMPPPVHGIGSPHHLHPGMIPPPHPHQGGAPMMMPPMMPPPFMHQMMGMMHPPFQHQQMGMPPQMMMDHDQQQQQQQQQQHIQVQTSEMINSTGYLDDGLNNSSNMTPKGKTKANVPTLAEIFDDLSSRFVINIPSEELESFDRLLFQIEAAFWFYDDFYREEHHSLPKYSLSEFTKVFFHHCPFLKPHKNQVEEILKQFSQYKTRVPVYGAIILNSGLDKALFVKGFHSSSWGFPKGKVNKDEPDDDCAVREVFEETGYDISSKLNPRHYIEITMKEQKIKLFIICGVPEDTPFMPRTRKEISKIEWLLIDELPTFTKKNNTQSLVKEKNFFRTIPFFIKLKKWIANKKRGNNKGLADDSGSYGMSTPKSIIQRPQPTTPSSSTSSLQPPPQYSPYPMSPPASPRQSNNTGITPIKSNNNINNNGINTSTGINLNSAMSQSTSSFPKPSYAAASNLSASDTVLQPPNKSATKSKLAIKSTFYDAKDTTVSYPPINIQNYQSRFNVKFDTEELVNCFRV